MSAGSVTGVLLANLGTPRSPRTADVRTYLREFLRDPDVVDLPRWVWIPLLELVVLPLRAPRSAHAYASIWSADGSPLLAHTLAQARALEARLGESFRVRAAMRYGEPSLAHALEELIAAGCERFVLLSAFPQECRATTGSVAAEMQRVAAARGVAEKLRIVPGHPEEPGYVAALAERVRELGPRDHWLFSFHGIPASLAAAGDPYPAQCERTANALAAALQLRRDDWTLCWQSRFGPARWLEPATDRVALERARRGQALGLVAPAFTADCLETLEELGLRLAPRVRAAGGELLVARAPNEAPAWIEALAALVRRTSEPGEEW